MVYNDYILQYTGMVSIHSIRLQYLCDYHARESNIDLLHAIFFQLRDHICSSVCIYDVCKMAEQVDCEIVEVKNCESQ